jgi:hypothetical protein
MDVVYLFANNVKQYIPAHIAETVAEHGEYTLITTVTDGMLHLGIVAEKAGTNWHSIQIKALDRIGIIGDANSDDVVDVADIASVISVMAKGNYDNFADVNCDGVVDVADIATIIDIMAASSRQERKDAE